MDNKKIINPLYLVIIVILLVLVGFLTFLLLKPKSSDPTNDQRTADTASQTQTTTNTPVSSPLSSPLSSSDAAAGSSTGSATNTSTSTAFGLSDTYSGVRSVIGLTSELNDEVTITLDEVVVGDKSFKGVTLSDLITDGTWMYQKFVVATLTFTAKQDTDLIRTDVSIYSSVNQGSSSYAMGDASYASEYLTLNGIYQNTSVPLKAGESKTLSFLILVPKDVITSAFPATIQITPYLYGDRYFEQTVNFDISQYIK